MAIESMLNENGKRSASDADLQITNISKRVQAEQQSVDHFSELRQRSVFGRYLDTVKFFVGPDAEPFILHTGLLIHRCPNLAEDLLPDNVVAQRQPSHDVEVRLSRHDPTCFWTFVVWLYTQELVRPPDEVVEEGRSSKDKAPDKRLKPGHSDKYSKFWRDLDLVNVYLFAKRYGIHELANAAISTLCAQNADLRRTTSQPAIIAAFSSISGKSLLCRYLAEEADLRMNSRMRSFDYDPTFPAEYFSLAQKEVDDMKGIVKTADHSTITDSCRYHTHEGHEAVVACEALRSKPAQSRKRHGPEYYHHLKDLATIYVGRSHVPFTVHKALLSAESEYFRGAFQSQMTEGRSGTITLEIEDPILFAQILFALYERLHMPSIGDRKCFAAMEVSIQSHVPAMASDNSDAISDLAPSLRTPHSPEASLYDLWQDELMDLYILCDRRDFGRLRKAIVQLLVKHRNEDPSWPLVSSSLNRINMVWENLPPGAGLRKYLVDEAAWKWRFDSGVLDKLAHMPADFLAQVLRNILIFVRDPFQEPASPAPWNTARAMQYWKDKPDEDLDDDY